MTIVYLDGCMYPSRLMVNEYSMIDYCMINVLLLQCMTIVYLDGCMYPSRLMVNEYAGRLQYDQCALLQCMTIVYLDGCMYPSRLMDE